MEQNNVQEGSAEQLLQSFREGNRSLAQTKTDEDGKPHYYDVYGEMNDGIDHFLNVFINMDSLAPIFSAVAEGKLRKPDQADQKEEYDGIQMTIDCTDKPIMWVLERSESKHTIRLQAYVRDERKGFREPAHESVWETTDGTLQITNETIEQDNNLIYAAIFGGLRNHLQAEGVVDQLRAMKKYSAAGVVVSANEAGEVNYRIVQGRQRPDLPCQMFLFGEITCRPYLDELLEKAVFADKSLEEITQEAENGNALAMEHLANVYLEGDDGDTDYKKSFYWWKKLAETGDATAQFNTGLYYAKGLGVERDFAKAAEWMRKSAENGDEDAAGAVEAYESAADNMKKAKAGDAAAQAELSKLYTKMGNSLNQLDADTDLQEAFMWAKKSADQGNPEGMYVLALCYEHGRGTEWDRDKADQLYEKAAKMGHAPSQWNLACHYLRWGNKEQEGLTLAYKAADQGYDLAISGLEKTGNTVEKIAEFYASEDRQIMLEGTQYEGRADRCEKIRPGDELTYKVIKDKHQGDALECFFRGQSVGLVYNYRIGKIMALLKMGRANLKITVRSIIPKSMRGARARNAEVTLNLILTEIKPETPEERKARLEKERIEREARLEKERLEKEAQRRAEEEKRKAEAEKKRLEAEKARKAAEEAKAKERAEQKAWEEEVKKVRETRQSETWKRQNAIVQKKEEDLQKCEQEKAETLARLERELQENTESIDKMEKELASLGLFAMRRKKELRESIEEGKKKAQYLEEDKEKAARSAEVKRAAIVSNADRDYNNVSSSVEKQYPLPESPAEKAQRKRKEEAARAAAEKARKEAEEAERKRFEEQKEQLKREKIVIEAFNQMDRPVTFSEFLAEAYIPSELGRFGVRAAISSLVSKGILTSTGLRGQMYYSLLESWDDIYRKWPDYKKV